MSTQDFHPMACQNIQQLFVTFNALVGTNKMNRNKRQLEAHTADSYVWFLYLLFDLSGFLAHASVNAPDNNTNDHNYESLWNMN